MITILLAAGIYMQITGIGILRIIPGQIAAENCLIRDYILLIGISLPKTGKTPSQLYITDQQKGNRPITRINPFPPVRSIPTLRHSNFISTISKTQSILKIPIGVLPARSVIDTRGIDIHMNRVATSTPLNYEERETMGARVQLMIHATGKVRDVYPVVPYKPIYVEAIEIKHCVAR